MGIYDREYYREEDRGGMFATRTMVTNLILINVGVFLGELFFDRSPGRMQADLNPHQQPLLWALSLDSTFLHRPWEIWRLLTYGFMHDANNLGHILFNMFGLWMFGRDVEGVYGRAEFLRIYLTAIVIAGLAWLLGEAVAQRSEALPVQLPYLVGASGGVMSIMLLYVLHYPRRTLYVFPIPLPIPAWALGVFFVAADLFGLSGGDHVAHMAHLGGAAFAFVYFRTGWNLGRFVPRRLSLSSLKLRPKLRIHDPSKNERDLTSEVDRILAKISREGEASLTRSERAVLEEASRKYQQRRQ